jgi:predicted phosphodiesterase
VYYRRWEAVLAEPDVLDTVVCGHTHMPFVRRARDPGRGHEITDQ